MSFVHNTKGYWQFVMGLGTMDPNEEGDPMLFQVSPMYLTFALYFLPSRTTVWWSLLTRAGCGSGGSSRRTLLCNRSEEARGSLTLWLVKRKIFCIIISWSARFGGTPAFLWAEPRGNSNWLKMAIFLQTNSRKISSSTWPKFQLR